MNIRKNKNQLIISIIIGIAAFAIFSYILSSLQQEINELKKGKVALPAAQRADNDFIVVKTDLKKGDTISAQNIEIKSIPVNVADGFKNANDVIGLVLIQDIKANEALTKEYFSPEDLPQDIEPDVGFRAIMFPVPGSVYIPAMKPMTYVDIYSSKGTIKIENARVLSVVKDTKAGKVVILEIKDDNVGDVIKLLNNKEEQLVLTLKNQKDDKTYRFSYFPQMGEMEKALEQVPGSLSPYLQPPNVNNYNIEQFVIKEAPPTTVEVIKGTEKTECGF